MIEYFFTCPYCWQNISFLIEEIEGGHSYIEDCEICCNPNLIKYKIKDDIIELLEVSSGND